MAEEDEEDLLRFAFERYFALHRMLQRLLGRSTRKKKEQDQERKRKGETSPNQPEDEPDPGDLSFDTLQQMRWALDLARGLLEELADEIAVPTPTDVVDANAEVLTGGEESVLLVEIKGLTSTVMKQARLADMDLRKKKALERGCSSAFTTDAYDKMNSRVADLAKQRVEENEAGNRGRAGSEEKRKKRPPQKATGAAAAEMMIARYKRAEFPTPAPDKLLFKGGHVLFCILDSSAGQPLNLTHFLEPIRESMVSYPVPLVVLAKKPPSDWYRVVDTNEVYFVYGSPIDSYDLERAGVRSAGIVIVYQDMRLKPTARDVQLLDAEAIFAVRMIESFPDAKCKLASVVLKHDENVAFTPLPNGSVPPKRKAQISVEEEIRLLHAEKDAAKEAAKAAEDKGKKHKAKKRWFELKVPARVQKLIDRLTGGMMSGDPAAAGEEGMDNVADLGLSYTHQPRY